MSALEKALRQIDAKQQDTAPWGASPYAMEPPPSKTRGDWFWRVLATLAMLVMFGMFVMAWLLFGDDNRLLRKFSHAGESAPTASAVKAPDSAASLPVAVSEAASAPGSALPAASAPVPAPGPAASPAAAPVPGWNASGEPLWHAGQHSEAARQWLDALRRLPPDTAVLQIAALQLHPQAKELKQTWERHFPVVVLAGPALGTRKRWTVLAVPPAAQLQQAQLQLSVAQRELLPVQTVSQWLALQAGESRLPAPAAQAPASAFPAHPVTWLPKEAVRSAPSTEAAPAKAPAMAASSIPVSAAPAGGVPAADPARSPGAADTAPERPSGPSGPTEVELQRVAPEKVSGNPAASAVAKSIEVDYQAVEKLLARGEPQAALDAAQKLEKSIGENWRTRFLAGVAQLGLGRLEDASTALARAQQLNPTHLLSAVYLTVALQERGEHGKAIQVVQRALEKNPASPELWLNLGHSMQATGQSAQARKAYQQFLTLSTSRQDLAAQKAWVQGWLQKDN